MPRPDQLKQPQIITLQFADLNRNDNFFLGRAVYIHTVKLSEIIIFIIVIVAMTTSIEGSTDQSSAASSAPFKPVQCNVNFVDENVSQLTFSTTKTRQ